MVFFQFNDNVTRTIFLVPFLCLHCSDHALRIAYCWFWRFHCIFLEQNSIGKRSKGFKASGFPCCILNNTHFFLKPVAEIRKKFMMSEKVGMSANKMVYAEGNFSWWGLYSSFRSIACVVDKQSSICRRYFLLKGLYVPSVKTTTYVCNRLNNSFCAKDHKTNQAISNLNRMFWNNPTLIWVGFLGVHF